MTNLDTVRNEVDKYVSSRGMVLFHSFSRSAEPEPVYWDTLAHPNFRMFLEAAEAAGVRLITLHARELTEEMLDDALERLEQSALSREERRSIESQIGDLRGYVGFTCQIEMSFDLAPRVYVFDLRTEWYEDLNDLLDRIEDITAEEDEEPFGGYFSKN